MSVIFLGTSAGQPTTKRGLSCIALERKGEIFLFDCGEASQIQFRRAGLRFGRVAAIFITHMHGDHVTGLPGLLMSLQMTGRTAPLRIVGPKTIGEYVEANFRLLESGLAFPLVISEHDAAGPVLEHEDYTVEVAPLDHRIPAIGYRFAERDFPGRFDVETALALGVKDPRLFGALQRGQAVTVDDGTTVRPEQVLGPYRRGKIFAYCADTRPCDASTRLGREADFMVHESTFADDRAKSAEVSGHSTAAQAAEVGRRAEARRLVLTHFSPRYDNLDHLLIEARPHYAEVEAAHELVEMPL
jgi:ribonuclease Z